jgi:hypothetical protein
MKILDKIIVKTSSGLGNQLFQVANGLEQANRLATTVVCDISGNNGVSDRQYALQKLESILTFKTIVSAPVNDNLRNLIEFHEKSEFKFDNEIMNITVGTRLNGYFQHPDYSQNSLSLILAALTEMKPSISDPHIIHVHFRRGDLASSALFRRKLGLLDIQYYVDAIQSLELDGINAKEIRVFSDSPLKAQELFDTVFYDKKIVIAPELPDPLANLLELSSASVLIGANSTFSWWAAKLAEYRNSRTKIIFPQGMLRNIPKSKVLLPENWSLVSPVWR